MYIVYDNWGQLYYEITMPVAPDKKFRYIRLVGYQLLVSYLNLFGPPCQ